MIFETDAIYRVNPEDNSLAYRSGAIDVVDFELTQRQLHFPFYASGILRHDLAVFGCAIDDTGVSEDGFLVVSSAQDQGLLASEQCLMSHSVYQTPELARKFATLHEDELVRLGMDSLISAVRQKYPGIRGFVR